MPFAGNPHRDNV